MVPKTADEYLTNLAGYGKLDPKKQPDSTIWHISDKGGNVPEYSSRITFSVINNLISALGTDYKELIFKYLKRYDPAIEKDDAVIEDLVNKGMNYYRDFVLPNKQYRVPTEQETEMLRSLLEKLRNYDGGDVKEIQTIPFDVARAYKVSNGEFFKMFYQTLLGQERGPRFGTFVGLVGKDKVIGLLNIIGAL